MAVLVRNSHPFRRTGAGLGVVRRQHGRVRRLDLCRCWRKWPAARLAILTCGKMTSASDCCKSQQRAGPTIAVAKHPDLAVVLALPASAPAPFAFVPTCRRSAPAAGLLKRPTTPRTSIRFPC